MKKQKVARENRKLEWATPYYLSFTIRNKDGYVHKLLQIFTRNNVRFSSMTRREDKPRYLFLSFLIEESFEKDIQNAIYEINHTFESAHELVMKPVGSREEGIIKIAL